jgi:hypothetical protein
LESLQHTIRKRVLRHFRRHGLLEPHDAQDMLGWEHGGGFCLNGSVRIEATDREGLERLIRYCARSRVVSVLDKLPRRLNGSKLLPLVRAGVRFKNGERIEREEDNENRKSTERVAA